MQRCDFSTVIGIIREYISEGNRISQPELICDLFYYFSEKNDDFEFDNGQINRWLKGIAPVSPKISEFYQRKSAAENLASDLESGIFPIMYDTAMAKMITAAMNAAISSGYSAVSSFLFCSEILMSFITRV